MVCIVFGIRSQPGNLHLHFFLHPDDMGEAHHDTPVVETESRDHLSACSLVLSAVNISHTISSENDRQKIFVAEEDAERARHHLHSYQEENSNWPPKITVIEEVESSIQPPTLLVIGALIAFYAVTGPWSQHSPWFINGAGNSTAILVQGEYYRLVTALTLHADLNHLLSNCLFGGFLFHFLCRSVGSGLGLTALLVSAAAGNTINVLLRGEGHLFVGFSTAVFAAIGMFVMVSYHANRKLSRWQVAAPFMAGAALLAMTGSSGVRTDLGAHLFGLLSGMAVGAVLITPLFITFRRIQFLQFVLFCLSTAAIYFCWQLAMQRVY